MKRLSLAAALALLFALPASASAPKAESVTLKGEVIDSVCYLDHGAHGAKHAQCAKTCLHKGAPASLLSNGKLYLLMAEHGNEAVMQQVADKGGEEITVTGKKVTKDGMPAVFVESIK